MSMLAAVPTCQSILHFFSKGGQFSASSAFVGASLATSTFVVLTFSFSEGASFATSFHVSYSFPTKGRPFSASCLSFPFRHIAPISIGAGPLAVLLTLVTCLLWQYSVNTPSECHTRPVFSRSTSAAVAVVQSFCSTAQT